MKSYFNDLFTKVVGIVDDTIEPTQSFVKVKNDTEEFIGFNNVYGDGLDILFLRGKLSKDIVLQQDVEAGDDHLIATFIANVQNITIYYPDENQSESKQEDIIVFHNYHSGFKIVFSAGIEFLLISVRFTGKLLEQATQMITNHVPNLFDSHGVILYIRHYLTPELVENIANIDKFLQMPNDFFIPYIRSKAHEMVTVSLYEIANSTSDLLKYSIGSEKLMLANKIRLLILEDLSVHFSISEIARQVGASETTIKEVFHRVNGVPIYNFYQNRRLAKAMQLLQTKEHQIIDIAYELGFSTSSNFSKFFKKMTNMSPREYLIKKTGSA